LNKTGGIVPILPRIARQDTSRGASMIENLPLKVGQTIPSFELETYDPVSGNFGSFSFEKTKEEKKWTILFFYPADFTFV
jgi:hypothetical protein